MQGISRKRFPKQLDKLLSVVISFHLHNSGKAVNNAITCHGFKTRSSRDFPGNLPALASRLDSLR